MVSVFGLFFIKQKTAYEMRISDWSSDVCSSDLMGREALHGALRELISVAVLWYEDDLLASDQGDAVNVVHGVLLGGRQYRAAYDLWNLRDHSVAALLQAVCPDRKRPRLNSSHYCSCRMPSSACNNQENKHK